MKNVLYSFIFLIAGYFMIPTNAKSLNDNKRIETVGLDRDTIRIVINFDDGCTIILEGELNFSGFHGTLTLTGSSAHCPTGTFIFRTANPNNSDPDIIEILYETQDICYANKIEFTSRNSNNLSVINYLNSKAGAILTSIQSHVCK